LRIKIIWLRREEAVKFFSSQIDFISFLSMMGVMDGEGNGDRIIRENPPVINVPPATGEMKKGKGIVSPRVFLGPPHGEGPISWEKGSLWPGSPAKGGTPGPGSA